MTRRSAIRRARREDARTCATLADLERLDREGRQLTDDFPRIKRAVRRAADAGKELSGTQIGELLGEVIELSWGKAHEMLHTIRNVPEFRRWKFQLAAHPGVVSRLAPEMLILAMIFAVAIKGVVHRTVVYQIINGMDSRLWHLAGMCSNKTRLPVSYNMVWQQMRRIENFPTAPDEAGNDAGAAQQFDIETVCDFDLLCRQLLEETIPTAHLKTARAASVDQTAFPSFFRTYDFRPQADIHQIIKNAGGEVPDDLDVGPDHKLIRCADRDARAGHRSASAATGYKATEFVGYQVALTALAKPTPTALPKDTPPGYIISMSCDPASCHAGDAALKATEDALEIAPNLKEVLTDRGISQYGERFTRPIRRHRLDIIQDLKSNEATMKVIEVGTGKHRQRVISADGDFFPLWMPEAFLHPPQDATEERLRHWYEQRAQYRWQRVQSFDNGGMQFRCPQCAGRVVTNLTTYNQKTRPNKSAPYVTVTHHDTKCCRGLATIPVHQLDHWQPHTWGTRAWKQSYNRRLQVENVNSMVKANGSLNPNMCRARGLGAHLLAALAAALAHNLNLAKTDPDADAPHPSSGQHHEPGPDITPNARTSTTSPYQPRPPP